MKVGLIARAEDRGLGIQTWEFFRAMQPDRTMVIDMGALGGGFEQHLHRYPGAVVAPFDGHQLPKDAVLDFLLGLDVVFSAETLYDWRIAGWARRLGVATVVQVNPEFYKHPGSPEWEHPSAWWNPTTWRMDTLPEGSVHVPVPVAADRFQYLLERQESRDVSRDGLRVLHVGGRQAVGDRNGSALVAHAARICRARVNWTVQTQERAAPRWRGQRLGTVRLVGHVPNYWDLYRDQDVLLLPRRYGGLCLPVNEAMAAGLAVAMSDTAPNGDTWPIVRMPGRVGGQVQVPCGRVPLYNTEPTAIARTVESLAKEPELLAACKQHSLDWATAHSWEALKPVYVHHLAAAALRP